jgi:hypothetical protein
MKVLSAKRIPRRGVAMVVALVAAASLVMGREKPASDAPVAKAVAAETTAAGTVDIDLSKLERAQDDARKAAPQANPFAPLSFAPPPPPRREARAKAGPPQAPPLPFRYAGKLTQDGKTEVFVVRGEEIISVAAGQNIDAEYRVDELSAERIAFTYLPLKTRQSLELEEGGAEGGG